MHTKELANELALRACPFLAQQRPLALCHSRVQMQHRCVGRDRASHTPQHCHGAAAVLAAEQKAARGAQQKGTAALASGSAKILL